MQHRDLMHQAWYSCSGFLAQHSGDKNFVAAQMRSKHLFFLLQLFTAIIDIGHIKRNKYIGDDCWWKAVSNVAWGQWCWLHVQLRLAESIEDVHVIKHAVWPWYCSIQRLSTPAGHNANSTGPWHITWWYSGWCISSVFITNSFVSMPGARWTLVVWISREKLGNTWGQIDVQRLMKRLSDCRLYLHLHKQNCYKIWTNVTYIDAEAYVGHGFRLSRFWSLEYVLYMHLLYFQIHMTLVFREH